MALSSCVKCGGSIFEIQENSPIGSNFKFNFIQCASCGGVVGVVDYYNIGSIAKKIEQILERIAARLGVPTY